MQLSEREFVWLDFQRKWVIEMTMDVSRTYVCLWVVFTFMKFVSEDNRKRVRQMDDLLHNKGTRIRKHTFRTDTTVFGYNDHEKIKHKMLSLCIRFKLKYVAMAGKFR